MTDEVLKFVGVVAGLVGVPALVGWWVVRLLASGITETMKQAIKSEYDAKLETLKQELKSTADTQLETLKNELKSSADTQLERHKHELALQAARDHVRFSRLHEIRAEVIGATYEALAKTYDALKAYTATFEPAGGRSKDERLEALQAELKRFREAFLLKKIFLPADLAKKLEAINAQVTEAQATFFWTVHALKTTNSTQKWNEVVQNVDGPIKTALEELEDAMRQLMGD